MHMVCLALTAALLQGGGKLEIKDDQVGTGPVASEYDVLSMDYTGKLANGTVFDSSKGAGRTPFVFVLGAGEVIRGWDEGIKGMRVGGKRTLTIPPDLAYGPKGTPDGTIPGNATLKFEVELKGVHKCQYKILKAGAGRSAKLGDSIEVEYVGATLDGKKFDSSKDHGGPMPVTLGHSRLPSGILQGLFGMKLGEKRKVTIPPEFAFGARKVGTVPPNSTITLEFELVKFLP